MCVYAAHPALDLRTSHCFCCSPSSSVMEKVCSGSILCSTWGQQKGDSHPEPHMQPVATQFIRWCVCAAGLQSSPHPDFSVRNVVLPKPWAVKRHQVLVGVVQNSLDAARVAGHDPRVVQPCWRAAEGREINRLHHSPKSLHEPSCMYSGFGCLCLPCRTAELKLWQALQCCPCWPSHTHL